MRYGRQKTSIVNPTGTAVTIVEDIYEGRVVKKFSQFSMRVRVNNYEQEMSEYLNFTKKVKDLQDAAKLYIDNDDSATYPAFTLFYPKRKEADVHFIILNWCEHVLNSA